MCHWLFELWPAGNFRQYLCRHRGLLQCIVITTWLRGRPATCWAGMPMDVYMCAKASVLGGREAGLHAKMHHCFKSCMWLSTESDGALWFGCSDWKRVAQQLAALSTIGSWPNYRCKKCEKLQLNTQRPTQGSQTDYHYVSTGLET